MIFSLCILKIISFKHRLLERSQICTLISVRSNFWPTLFIDLQFFRI